ncbi:MULTISPECIES: hypothetical protein [Paraburkholderia]|uniref:Transposase n=2 Tax=Paraburkholderia tropica TaxID=92647 RepID=A0ABX5MPB8_9BURK|nr:hypothetical protein [Paraburkholderia tropica]MBB3000895.1 hypothetical protein [Paraburkholderia tropica]MBB6319317.1 hypothetical protein [Paraburkholderia tropica]PXX16315.1 hypothetical protein C7400_108122 [Paraburkholderia tropica]PZW82707.1 hypothetical protein C7399_108122 [Paraburkholderia tropica]QNB10770.1 hypothetical protein G5S35_03700 [Paraburkholderia tropica]
MKRGKGTQDENTNGQYQAINRQAPRVACASAGLPGHYRANRGARVGFQETLHPGFIRTPQPIGYNAANL